MGSMGDDRSASPGALLLARLLALASVALVAGGSTLVVFGDHALDVDSGRYFFTGAVAGLSYAACGYLLAVHRPDKLLGWVFVGPMAVGMSLSALALPLSAYDASGPGGPAWIRLLAATPSWCWLAAGVWLPTIVVVLLTKPTLDRLARAIVVSALVLTVPLAVFGLTNPFPYPDGPAQSPLAITNRAWIDASYALYPWLWRVVLGLSVLALARLARRWRVAGHDEPELAWFLTGGLAAMLTILSSAFPAWADRLPDHGAAIPYLHVVALPFVAVASVVAMLRYRLWGIQLALHRTLTWLALMAGAVGVYASLAGLGGKLIGRGNGFGPSLLAAAVIAALLAPAQRGVESIVDKLVYGARRDPYALVGQLGAGLQGIVSTDELVPAVVDALASALHLPYVAVEVPVADEWRTIAVAGTPPPACVTVPLGTGTVGGRLVIGRWAGTRLTAADRQMFEDMGNHVGVIVRLVDDVTKAQQLQATARHDERRKLRRELHDRIGPTVAGVANGVEALAATLDPNMDVDAARSLLVRLSHELGAAVVDIRRLAYETRPPALDQLGLVDAVRSEASAVSAVEVELDLPDDLSALSPASETAAYRIIVEALRNVDRHAGARQCSVRLTVGSAIEIQVDDDGIGGASDRPVGVGIMAMRERAAEVEGTVLLLERPGGGTRLVARLPCVGGGRP
jgi:signal transduction histidine kinase